MPDEEGFYIDEDGAIVIEEDDEPDCEHCVDMPSGNYCPECHRVSD